MCFFFFFFFFFWRSKKSGTLCCFIMTMSLNAFGEDQEFRIFWTSNSWNFSFLMGIYIKIGQFPGKISGITFFPEHGKKLVARLRNFEEYIVCFSMTMSLNAFDEDQENSAFTEKKRFLWV